MQQQPFINVTQTEDGDEVFEGLCIDLLNKLSDKMGFHYIIRLIADGQYGDQLEDGSWTGLVGDLVNQVSHSITMIINSSLYISLYRELNLQWLH